MSHVIRKPAFCICGISDNHTADQCLCFRYIDSSIQLVPLSEILSPWPSSVSVQPGLCLIWSETQKTASHMTRLIHVSAWVCTQYPWISLSLVVRKPAFCICENKGADQLRGNCEADQHLCFPYTDSTIPLLPKHKI